MSDVLDAVRTAAMTTPRSIRVSFDGGALTCDGLHEAVQRLAERLSSETRPVGVALDNGCDWVVADLALIAAGRPCVPLPPFFTAEQRRHALVDSGASALILRNDGAPDGPQGLAILPTQAPVRTLHEGTAKVTYTSGSTGQPKGVCLSQAQMEAVSNALVTVLGRQYAGVHLPILPLGVLLENVAGLYSTLLAGGRYHALGLAQIGFGQAFRPDFGAMLRAVAESRATSLILTPELLRGLIAARQMTGLATPDLTLVAVGGARVSTSLLAAAEAAGLPVVEGYGLTECASVVAMNLPGDADPETVGRPLPHLSVTLADDGEILVSPRPFLGYVGLPAAESPLATGDLGAFDAAGRLRIQGRKSNVLITAFGRNVAPEWVESELLSEPEILQAVVFGEAQPQLGALVVSSAPPVAVEAAVARANTRLPAYAQVGRWKMTPPFDPAAGQLTGNGRPRREALLSAYADFVSAPA